MLRKTFASVAFRVTITLTLAASALVIPVARGATTAYRAFSGSSYWNTPIPADAPRDVNSALYIADSEVPTNSQNYLRLVGAPGSSQDYAEPIYWADEADPLVTVTPTLYGDPVTMHIPADAQPAPGTDSQMTVYDLSADYRIVAGFHKVSVADGQWTAVGVDRWQLESNGLDGKLDGSNDSYNRGHRGVPASVRAVRFDEILAGAINHRLACYWHATADSHFWPMVGHELGRGGVVPEGIVVRIKPTIDLSQTKLTPAALTIARALQTYGCTVGDNSGSGNSLKLQRNADWRGLLLTAAALKSIPWNDWEFVQGGYRPPTRGG